MSASKDRLLIADDKQESLFDCDQDWQSHWKGMPEFVQLKQEPYQKIIMRFSCQADVEEFARRLGLQITPKTKDAWFPPLQVKRLEKVIVEQ